MDLKLRTFKIEQDFKSLPAGMEWDAIPAFAVITGKNGAGKSQLLEHMNTHYNLQNRQINICYLSPYQQFAPMATYPSTISSFTNEANSGRTRIIDAMQKLLSRENLKLINDHDIDLLAYKDYNEFHDKQSNPYWENFYKIYHNDRGLVGTALGNIPNLFSLVQDQRWVFVQIAEKLNKPLKDISLDEFTKNLPADIGNTFANAEMLRRWFSIFINNYDTEAGVALREGDVNLQRKLRAQQAPWVIMNDILAKYGFKYQLKNFDPKQNPLKIEFTDGTVTVPIESLSSGEQQLIALVAWAHHDIVEQNIELLLLDEPDAHLHPSFCKIFMEIIQEYVVKKGIQALMTTHSPSTVAYAPEEAVHVMNMPGEEPRIEKQSKEKALDILTDGFVRLNEEGASFSLLQSIKNYKSDVLLFTEGFTDCLILQHAFDVLGVSKDFCIQNTYGHKFLRNFIINDMGAEDLKKTVIAMFDFDAAYTEWDKKHKDYHKLDSSPHNSIIYSHKTKKVYVFFLPEPSYREKYSGENIKNPVLTIELLFEDSVIKDYCEKETVAGGGEILKFMDSKKITFAKSLSQINSEKFQEFKKIYNILNWIKNYNPSLPK